MFLLVSMAKAGLLWVTEKKVNEISKEEESKVEKFQRTIESGAYRLDMEKTARAIVGF